VLPRDHGRTVQLGNALEINALGRHTNVDRGEIVRHAVPPAHLGAAATSARLRAAATMNGGPRASDEFHTPSQQVDEELKALRDENSSLRSELRSCKSELEAAQCSASAGATADATLQPAEPEPPAEAPARGGMPPFAWALLTLGIFCNGIGGHLEVAQTGVRPAALKMQWRLAFAAACALPIGLLSLCGAETRRALRLRWVWGWLLVCR